MTKKKKPTKISDDSDFRTKISDADFRRMMRRRKPTKKLRELMQDVHAGPWPGEEDQVRPFNPNDPADETWPIPGIPTEDFGPDEALNAAICAANPTAKPSNPKDVLGILKVPFSTVSSAVIAEIGVGMFEGARKYGRHNYRVIGVRASVYYDATMRHLTSWFEGEDIDPASGINHIGKALASLVVLRDAMFMGNLVDDRPPPLPTGWQGAMDDKVKEITARMPNAVPPYTAVGEAAKRENKPVSDKFVFEPGWPRKRKQPPVE